MDPWFPIAAIILTLAALIVYLVVSYRDHRRFRRARAMQRISDDGQERVDDIADLRNRIAALEARYETEAGK
jgi:DNA-binding PadR family transcriptional regulator